MSQHPALTKHPGNFSVKKDAKNVFLEKSHLCFNQEQEPIKKKTYTLSCHLLGLALDSRFRFFSH